MGNYVSCKLSDPIVLPISLSKSTKIFLPTGEIRKLQEPIKAAELMLESPNFFVVNACTLKIGRRFCALNADDDLDERASTYMLFPMHRKNSVVTANDLGRLSVTANTSIKRASKGDPSRVLPESVGEVLPDTAEEAAAAAAAVPRIDSEGVEETSTPEFRYRMSMGRSKRPSLDTIREEPRPCQGNALPVELLLKIGGQKWRYILHPKLCSC